MKSIKKYLIVVVLIISLIPLLSFTACAKTVKKTVKVIGSGSTAYISTTEKAPYTISELNIKSTRNAFYFPDYVVDESAGKEYEIKNSKNKKVGTIKLSKKEEIYNPEKFQFNLDTYDKKVIVISEEMNYVEIFSADPSVERDIFICIYNRGTPLDLTLNNVNLHTKECIPVIFNASKQAINVIVKGNNVLMAGEEDISDEEYEEFEKNKEELLKGLSSGLKLVKGCAGSSSAYLFMAYTFISETVEAGVSKDKTFFDALMGISDTLLEKTKMLYEDAISALIGKYGKDGRNGIETIQAVDISFVGDGRIKIVGGNGTKGFDASTVAMFGANGGNGGDAGSAIICHTYINLLNYKNYEISCGQPGSGGYGTSGLGGNNGYNGQRGNFSPRINYYYKYEL